MSVLDEISRSLLWQEVLLGHSTLFLAMPLEQGNHLKRFPKGLVYVAAGALFWPCTAKALMNELNFFQCHVLLFTEQSLCGQPV